MDNQLPTFEFVCEALDYCPHTGLFTWKKRPPSHFKTETGWKIFNSNETGKSAGARRRDGYLTVNINGKLHLNHRLAWLISRGEWPSSSIDHINGVKDDNRISNLRVATKAQNAMNSKLPVTNTSGIKGVSWYPPYQKWRARLRAEGKSKTIGYFCSLEEASLAMKEARNLYHGEFANH